MDFDICREPCGYRGTTIYCRFTNIGFAANSTGLNKAYLYFFPHIFSISHIIDFLHLGTLDRTSALHLGDILNSEFTNKKHQDVKNEILNKLSKGHCLQYELKQEGRISYVQPQLGVCVGWQIYHFSAHLQTTVNESTMSIDSVVINKF